MNARSLTWPAVVLVAILGGLVLGLSTLTDLTAGAIIGVVGVLGGIGGGAAVVSAGAGPTAATAAHIEEIHSETKDQTETLNTVARRVNGELDARIAAAVEDGNGAVVAEMMQAMRDAGVIPRA